MNRSKDLLDQIGLIGERFPIFIVKKWLDPAIGSVWVVFIRWSDAASRFKLGTRSTRSAALDWAGDMARAERTGQVVEEDPQS